MASRLVVETITPERAAALLTSNTENRHVRPGIVRAYARDMAVGRWVVTGAPIVLNGRRVLDGQHRLLACIEAGVPFETAVMYDADESIHFAIDKGMKRTIGDELRWAGETDALNLGAALSLLWAYDHGVLLDARARPSSRELLELLGASPQLRDSINYARRLFTSIRVPRSTGSVIHFLIDREHGTDVANEFADLLADGGGLTPGDPLLTLRQYAINVASTRNSRTRPYREEWLAVAIKAANGWLLGRPMLTVRWRRYGKNAEAFPVLVPADVIR